MELDYNYTHRNELIRINIGTKKMTITGLDLNYNYRYKNICIKFSYNLGNISLIHICCKDKDNDVNKNLDKTIYLDNETLEVISDENKKCFHHKVSYFIPNDNPCLVYRIIYDKMV